MNEEALYKKKFPVTGGDFDKAGEVSTQIKAILKTTGIDNDIIRKVAIASFEAEMNVVIHAEEGKIEFILTTSSVIINVADKGPGIKDIDLAMQEGYSTASDDMREMGFGAGMGLPNIKKSADDFEIKSKVGKGTWVRITIHHEQK
ncbi:ATP-binding protein [bacterium]|nr:ATP-binding protein [bacterium]